MALQQPAPSDSLSFLLVRKHLAGALGLMAASAWAPPALGAARETAWTSLRVVRQVGTEDCPGTAELVREVNAAAKRQAVRSDRGGPSSLTVRITRGSGGYRAQIRAEGAITGVRVIEDEGATCAGLGAALAVTVALLADEAAPAQRGAAAANDGRLIRVRGKQAARRGGHAELELAPRVAGGAAFGVLPEVAPILGGELGFTVGHWSAALGPLGVPEQRWKVEGIRARGSWWAVSVMGCYGLLLAKAYRPRIAACARSLSGMVRERATGDRVTSTDPASRPWWAVGSTVRLTGRSVGRLEWGVEGAVLRPIVSERFGLGAPAEVILHSPAKVVGITGLLLGWSIP